MKQTMMAIALSFGVGFGSAQVLQDDSFPMKSVEPPVKPQSPAPTPGKLGQHSTTRAENTLTDKTSESDKAGPATAPSIVTATHSPECATMFTVDAAEQHPYEIMAMTGDAVDPSLEDEAFERHKGDAEFEAQVYYEEILNEEIDNATYEVPPPTEPLTRREQIALERESIRISLEAPSEELATYEAQVLANEAALEATLKE